MSKFDDANQCERVFKLINTIHFETMLLESLDWDEEKLAITQQKLSEYFDICTKKDLDLVKADLDLIFNETITNVVYNYLNSITTGED